jgi:hypothetical protein
MSREEAEQVSILMGVYQGCQIFLGPKYQKGENIPNYQKYTKWPQDNSNDCKIDQMGIKYTKIVHSKTLQNLSKLGFFGLKTNHLATLVFIQPDRY